MIIVELEQVRAALVAEVREERAWHSRQLDFGTPQWKAEQIADEILRKANLLREIDELEELAQLADGEYDPEALTDLLGLGSDENGLDMDDYDLEDLCDIECALAENHSGLWDC